MMRVLYPGHRYALDNLESEGETILQFYQDAALHNGEGCDGPSCQEVLRAVIDRVEELDRERPWEGNAAIVYDLRHAIAGFEARAIIRRVEKDGLAIERQPLAADGHLLLAIATAAGTDETRSGSAEGNGAGRRHRPNTATQPTGEGSQS